MPERQGQKVCGKECAAIVGKEETAKAIRKDTRERRAKAKRLPDLKRALEAAFNKFIRLRDRNQLCICCDEPLGDQRYGGAYDAGHYRSVGSAPHLRFVENNVHAQRKYCNSPKGLSGNHVEYRKGLIKRKGLAAVEELEADNTPRHYTREQLIEITKIYRQKARDLEKFNHDS